MCQQAEIGQLLSPPADEQSWLHSSRACFPPLTSGWTLHHEFWLRLAQNVKHPEAPSSVFGKKVTSVACTAGEVQPRTAPPLKPHSLKYEVRSKQDVFSLTLFPLDFTKILTDFIVFLSFCYRWRPPKCPLHCTLQHIILVSSTTFFPIAFLIIKSIYGGQSAPESIPGNSLVVRGKETPIFSVSLTQTPVPKPRQLGAVPPAQTRAAPFCSPPLLPSP